MSAPCPHCGQPLPLAPGDLVYLVETFDMANAQRILARAILACWPRRVTGDALIADLWSIRREPENARNTVQSHLSKLNTKLEAAGAAWRIRGRRFEGYRFEEAAP